MLFFAVFLLYSTKCDTSTFLNEYNKIKNQIPTSLEVPNLTLPGGHYTIQSNLLDRSEFNFTSFSILEITANEVGIIINGPVYVRVLGSGVTLYLVGDGIMYPFIETTGKWITLVTRAHIAVEDCVLQTLVSLSNTVDAVRIEKIIDAYTTITYSPGSLYYLCGFQDVDIRQVGEISAPSLYVHALQIGSGDNCVGDMEVIGGGARRLDRDIDRMMSISETHIGNISDGEYFEQKLSRGNYGITVGNARIKLYSDEPCVVNIYGDSDFFEAEINGPIFINGIANRAHFITTINTVDIAAPIFNIEGSCSYDLRRAGDAPTDTNIFLGKLYISISDLERQRGIDIKPTYYGSNSHGYALGYNNTNFFWIKSADIPEFNEVYIVTITEKIPPNSALLNGLIIAAGVLVVIIVVVIILVYIFVIRPRRLKKEQEAENDIGKSTPL